MVYELVKLFNKPFGVVLNKCLEDSNPAEHFCIEKGIKILKKIPFDGELGALNSNAMIVSRVCDKYSELFNFLLREIEKEVPV
jgi:MinD superfamily P-loop ATPase